MNVGFYDHRGLGQPFALALGAAGHTIVDPSDGDVLLADIDHPNLACFIDCHDRVVLYPHSGMAAGLDYDQHGTDKVLCRFVIGPGHVELLALDGDTRPAEVIGWPWTTPQPFKPARSVKRVLFAPLHPGTADGYLPPPWGEANARALDVVAGLDVQVTVSHVGALAANGLTPIDSVTFQEVDPVIDDQRLAGVDLVVAAPGTFLAVAVAAGVPAVTYGQSLSPHRIGRYPYDLDDGIDLLDRAAFEEAADWRRRYVGDPFDPHRFVALFAKAVEAS